VTIGHTAAMRTVTRVSTVVDRRWLVGAGVVMSALAVLVLGPLLVAMMFGGAVATLAFVRRGGRTRAQRELRRTLPDVVDLLRLGAEVDLTVFQAVSAVADHGLGPVARQAATVVARTRAGVRLVDALEHLRCDPVLAPLADALIDAERYGTPLVRSLERLGTDARDQRRRLAEARARRLPVQLLGPLVMCTLPATLVLAVVPVAMVSLDGLTW
jgi:tight adherence protein C